MPELAEVEYYRKRWDPGLGGKVTGVSVHAKARVFRDAPGTAGKIAKAVTGEPFRASFTHGKNLLFRFGNDVWIGGHLGMTGSLRELPSDHTPERHDHLVLRQKGRCLAFTDPRMFGRLRLHRGKSAPTWWDSLPPGVLSNGFTKSRVAGFLQRRTASPVKALLLEQEIFPGIGNWMADEILWRIQLHPETHGGALSSDQSLALWKETRSVTRQALKVIGTTWDDPPNSWLFNHRWKDGGHCPRCHTELTRAPIRGRTSCWCEKCQG